MPCLITTFAYVVERSDCVENGQSARPFYLIVAFWGQEYRQHFLQLCLPSLLSPGNIPSLLGKRSCRFLICTTSEDWTALSADPLFDFLKQNADPVFVELCGLVPDFLRDVFHEKIRRGLGGGSEPSTQGQSLVSPLEIATPGAFGELQALGREMGVELTGHHEYAARILFMSAGHKACAAQAHQDQAFGIFLAPDMVLSDRALTYLDELANLGKKVVMVSACRFSLESAILEFQKKGLMVPGQPLVLPSRKLVEVVFECMHPETACFEFDSPFFCNPATSSFWKIPGDSGVLLHSFFWAPLLVSYWGMETHHLDYFDTGGTTDGKYIAMHFDCDKDITSVTDSDEMFLASFTPQKEYYYSVKKGFLKQIPVLNRLYKMFLIRRSLYGPMGDKIKRNLYGCPIRLHSQPLSNGWEIVENQAMKVVKRAMKPPGIWGRTAINALWVKDLFSGGTFFGRFWNVALYCMGKLPTQWRQQLKKLIGKSGLRK